MPELENREAQNNTAGHGESWMHLDVLKPRAQWIILFIILVVLAIVRMRLLAVPLERDEGEYAYMGQLLLKGIPPYSAAYNMKFPGVYLIYALIMAVFGQTAQGVHLGLLAVNCLAVLLIFLLGKKLANDVTALAASGVYAVLSLSPTVFGSSAHATQFMAAAAVGGAVCLPSAVERNRLYLYFLSGMLFGMALLMKQPGIFFTVFGLSYVLYAHMTDPSAPPFKQRVLAVAVLASASLLPMLLAMLWLSAAGVFGKFWFWTVRYAAEYAMQVPLFMVYAIFENNTRAVVGSLFPYWILSGLGFLVLLKDHDLRRERAFVILFALFSFLTIVPGFHFRKHYYVTLLPAVSLAAGICLNYLCSRIIKTLGVRNPGLIGVGIIAAVLLPGGIAQSNYYLKDSPTTVSRKMYNVNPFPESVEIGRFIKANSSPEDRIAVFGSEPQIYFYSDRLSATGYIYMYPLMEKHDFVLTMQKEMAREIESSRPKFIIDVQCKTSWFVRKDSEPYLFSWFTGYAKHGYRLAGIVDIYPDREPVYTWRKEAENSTPSSESYVLILERKQ